MAEKRKSVFVINDGPLNEFVPSGSQRKRQQKSDSNKNRTQCRQRKSTNEQKSSKYAVDAHHSDVYGDSECYASSSLLSESTESDLVGGKDIDSDVSYLSLIASCNAVTPVDEGYRAFLLQDMDVRNKKLKDQYVIVRRRILKTPDNFVWLYGCSCNPARQRMMDVLSSDLSHSLEDDFDDPYQKCIHISTMEHLASGFTFGLTMEAEYERDTSMAEEVSGDHAYDKEKPKVELYGLEGNGHIVCVRMKEFGQCPTYSVVSIKFSGRKPCLQCSSCKDSPCKHTKAVLDEDGKSSDLSLAVLRELNMEPKWRSRYVPVAVSSMPIPFNVPPEEQKQNRLNFSKIPMADEFLCLIPTVEGQCDCGESWGMEEELEELKVYTDKDILPAKVFIRKCSNSTCTNWKEYDGTSDQLINMGSYLVSHQVLRSYMIQYLTEGSTLSSFYKEWCWRQMNSGNFEFSDEFSYNRFRYAWYSFLQLLNIEYSSGYACPKCGDCPETVVMDGVSLGVRKSFMPWKDYLSSLNSSTATLDGSSHNTRNFVNNQKARHLLQKYTTKGLSPTEFTQLCRDIAQYQPSLKELLNAFQEDGFTYKPPDVYVEFLRCLSSTYAVCGLLHFHPGLFDLLHQISSGVGITGNANNIALIEQQVPLLARLFKNINWKIPAYLRPVIKELVVKAKQPFACQTSHNIPQCSSSCGCSGHGFFPNLPKLCHRGDYVLDKKTGKQTITSSCTKRTSSHPSLIPGIFTLSCVHGKRKWC